ncbi:hypothetical protein [Alloyangia pacifica]|uniref:hypothetical protein n=1 Tax=Alloyangia pacifica TaxID=311180 RepID=UPI001CFE841D|nr:hypothetical protein [Alloyangia pacifica]
MEASTGIEPVYTDLQSSRFHKEINQITRKGYQDKARTSRELDTRKKLDLAKKNPAETAISNGAEDAEQIVYVWENHTPVFPLDAMHGREFA